ncbi:unnamed protein product [Peronospora belbahrii]|uniref:FYVE-type domain-containing protein n=1 Tax=Peronospora belbahrii TaxID=622444 RepID=A0ABN8CSE3_9STRA|nr:unnamed protein product [Peronospora belbahrii]
MEKTKREEQFEAVCLARALDWKSLQRLLEKNPHMAKQCDDHGMLPIHWACTVRRVPLSLLAKLLQAYPEGVQIKNDGDLLPLHIAIRAGMQALCLRKLVRAYPDAVNERTPDGVSALEMAQDIGLDAESLKVLYRVYERRSLLFQQQNGEDSSSNHLKRSESDPKQVLSEQEEGEVSGVERPEDEENDWTDAAVSKPFVGNTGSSGFLYVGDDGELDAVEKSTLEPEDSISIMSEQSLSDIDGLDTPHDHLVSPSSISMCSQDDPRTPSSSHMSFSAVQLRNSSHRRLLVKSFQDQSHQKSQLPQQKQMHHMTSLLTQLQENGAVSNRELRTMVSAIGANVTEGKNKKDALSRSHGRHRSLPVMPSHGYLRQNSSFQFDNEADDEDEYDGHDVGSSRGSTSSGGAVGVPASKRDSLFFSVQKTARRQATRSGSHRSSPPLFRRSRRRASHGSNDRGHFDPPPEWKHDGECSICRASFGMFKHRHHCRNCGKSICSQHSADKKISMEAKGFTTPQRVCVTCYAMITHSRSLKHDQLELEDNGREGPLLNNVAFQQQQRYAFTPGAGASDRYGVGDVSFPSLTTPLPNRSIAFGSSQSLTTSDGSLGASPITGRKGSSRKATVLAAGEATGGIGEHGTTNHASRLSGAPSSSAVHELRSLLASQQKQIEQLAESNMQMQQQLLEQEELKAETMLLITQLMTRVSVLELQQDRSSRYSKRRSAGTGDSEDEDEEFPQDDSSPFHR